MLTSSNPPVDTVIDIFGPLVRGLNQYEQEVSEEEHESVVEHDRVEERLVRQDQVDDVGEEQAEDGDAQHDGVEDAENCL